MQTPLTDSRGDTNAHSPIPKLIDGRPARVAIVGAGAFGQALAASAVNGGNQVALFARDESTLSSLQTDSCLSACSLFEMNAWTGDLSAFDLVLLAVPCQALRTVCSWICESLKTPQQDAPAGLLHTPGLLHILSAAKGIEQKTLLLPNQVLRECLPAGTRIGALSGPSFARELRQGLPTAVVAASECVELLARAEGLLHRSFFRVYGTADIVGVEVGGALKNVIAMVAGAVDGLGFGNNARAAVITRGLGEIAQVGVKLGADPMTFLGLGGLGDLILTCTGDLSRNRQFGLKLAAGESPQAIAASMGQVIEGVTTAQSAYQLSRKLELDTPILKAAYAVLYENLSIKEAMLSLVNRERKGEFDWIQK